MCSVFIVWNADAAPVNGQKEHSRLYERIEGALKAVLDENVFRIQTVRMVQECTERKGLQ